MAVKPWSSRHNLLSVIYSIDQSRRNLWLTPNLAATVATPLPTMFVIGFVDTAYVPILFAASGALVLA